MQKICDKIRILQIMNKADSGGISAVVLNYYKALDRTKIHFDCAMPDIKLGAHGKELQSLDSNFFQLPLKSKHPFKYYKQLKKILIEGKYDAIHVHGNETSFYPLYIAKKAKTQIRIAHAHTARKPVGIINKLKRLASVIFTKSVATKLVACTKDAATATFGKKSLKSNKLVILKNSIDTEKFRFNEEKRIELRKSFDLDNEFCLCCVGNMDYVKNQKFVLEIFKEILRINDNSHLILVGDGPLRNNLEQYAKELSVFDKVSFLGRRSDVCDILQASDAFVMPSFYEGFAIAALEAAATGNPIYLSDTIPDDLSFYSQSHYISLDESAIYWANEILSINNYDRLQGVKEVREAGFEIKDTAKELQAIYEK